jgi:hypothetical protein
MSHARTTVADRQTSSRQVFMQFSGQTILFSAIPQVNIDRNRALLGHKVGAQSRALLPTLTWFAWLLDNRWIIVPKRFWHVTIKVGKNVSPRYSMRHVGAPSAIRTLV